MVNAKFKYFFIGLTAIGLILLSGYEQYTRRIITFTLLQKARPIRPNAVILILTRNADLEPLVSSLRHFERRFNLKFNYPYVLLNDEPFSDAFKARITEVVMNTFNNKEVADTARSVKFGVIPKEQWSYPEGIDQKRAAKAREELFRGGYPYGESEPYRHMCRYFSGFFFLHPLLQQYDYFWRIEPGIKLHCPIEYDVFEFLQNQSIEFAFSIATNEFPGTVETLLPTTKRFLREIYPKLGLPKLKNPALRASFDDTYGKNEQLRNEYVDSLLDPSKPDPDLDPRFRNVSWNYCQFWNNFEMGSLRFFRSKAYQSFFDYLDKSGGFYYERWGDAAIHTLGTSLFLETSQIHHFHDIAYMHAPLLYCPADVPPHCNCGFDWNSNVYNYDADHCSRKFFRAFHNHS